MSQCHSDLKKKKVVLSCDDILFSLAIFFQNLFANPGNRLATHANENTERCLGSKLYEQHVM